MSNVQERHMDYVWSLPTLQPGQPVTVPFQVDPDAPFALRGLAARVPYDAAGTQNGLQSVSLRWSGPMQDYRQQSRNPIGIMMGAYFGQYGNPRPVYPQVRFPENGVTWIDIINNGAIRNNVASTPAGTMSCLDISLAASAMGCSKPA